MPNRLKNETSRVAIRNDGDSADIGITALDIKLTGGVLGDGKILTSDATGLGSWQVNPAIQAAQDAQSAADNAQSAANTAQTTANTAQSTATAAQTTANAAAVEATAAAAAAAAAGVTATAAAAVAATANALAGEAYDLAQSAQLTANNALALAAEAYPYDCRVFGDELIWDVGTPSVLLNQPAFPYSWLTFTSVNNAEAHYDLQLRGGTWTFHFLVAISGSAGRVTIGLNGVPIVDPLEMYSAVANNAARFTYTGVPVSIDGINRLIFKVNGKHASSSGFGFAPIKFWGYRTGS